MKRNFSIIRRISRNAVIRKIMPYKMQLFFWNFVLKNKGERLRKEIIKYYGEGGNKLFAHNGKIKESIDFLKKERSGFYSFDFLKIWLANGNNMEEYFNFNGAVLPDISHDAAQMNSLLQIFQDTFLFHCLLDDNYDRKIVERFDPCMMEGPYGYIDKDINVTVMKNDIVADVGAWIGDFSAYAATKGAIVYAFEPVARNYELLTKTADLNAKKIIAVKYGLGNNEEDMEINVNENNTAGSSMYLSKSRKKETIKITTLDKFAEKINIKKLDFIKADIEGGERYLLWGAKRTLKEFAPKLAICTYHSPEDSELLEKIILDSNPRYCIKHTMHKLFAMVK
jgi:FkbM family methyltransferase